MIAQFSDKLKESGLYPLKPTEIEIFQVNVGKMCNQVCHHCHVDAGPHRKEIMSRETMDKCVEIVDRHKFPIVDLTGGAPEMNPNFRGFVEDLRRVGAHVIDRCNLTIILANPKYHDLPLFFKVHSVEVVSSLPHFSAHRTDRQRGEGVFAKSIRALQMLNEVGYGKEGSGLKLNLVYNPAGAFLPDDQAALEKQFKEKLKTEFGVQFNQLFCITNMPISRYLEYLHKSGNYESYMTTLTAAYNSTAAAGVMCRNTISIGWDGQIYDCDFNQMLDLPVALGRSMTVNNFSLEELKRRDIVVGQHCFGCTAGQGSSCGGTTA